MLAFWFVAEAGVGNSNKMFIAFMLFRMEKVGFVSKLKVASLSAAETSFAARIYIWPLSYTVSQLPSRCIAA